MLGKSGQTSGLECSLECSLQSPNSVPALPLGAAKRPPVHIRRFACCVQVMSGKEVAWVDAYHRQVWEALSPRLAGEELEWLRQATSPL
jgi:hypothetical protein